MLDAPAHSGNIKPSAKDPFQRLYKVDSLLKSEEEFALANAWRDHHDVDARNKMITAYLPLASRMAYAYSKHSPKDIRDNRVAEAQAALLKAAENFDPSKGFRFSTYAKWWIKAALQQEMIANYSLVKLGTTQTQKTLFFNLRRAIKKIQSKDSEINDFELNIQLSQAFGIDIEKIQDMRVRLQGDQSLNAPQSGEEGAQEWIDTIKSQNDSAEETVSAKNEFGYRSGLVKEAMSVLSERDRGIFTQRRLQDPPPTLEELSCVYGVSRERIRQIELEAFEKVKKRVQILAYGPS